MFFTTSDMGISVWFGCRSVFFFVVFLLHLWIFLFIIILKLILAFSLIVPYQWDEVCEVNFIGGHKWLFWKISICYIVLGFNFFLRLFLLCLPLVSFEINELRLTSMKSGKQLRHNPIFPGTQVTLNLNFSLPKIVNHILFFNCRIFGYRNMFTNDQL